jgi:hypothetical protein
MTQASSAQSSEHMRIAWQLAVGAPPPPDDPPVPAPPPPEPALPVPASFVLPPLEHATTAHNTTATAALEPRMAI